MREDAVADRIREIVSISYTRSGGPGGQNVNKVNTKAVARLAVTDLDLLSEEDKQRLRERLHNRINSDGEIVVSSQRHRTQRDNRRAVVERLILLVLNAIRRVRRRKPSKPSQAAVERRLETKRRLAEKKRRRRLPPEAM
jgi:ribosome-associated protein